MNNSPSNPSPSAAESGSVRPANTRSSASRSASGPWHNRSAIISGGSSGLGLMLARALAPQVRRLVLTGRSPERLTTAREELLKLAPHGEIHTLAVDAAATAGSQELGRFLQSDLGGTFDLLINAVGKSDRGRLVDLSPDRLHELFDANVVSTLLTTQATVPSMSDSGVIVNIGSLSGLFAPRFLGGYSIVKHGLTALSQQMRLELAERGLHVLLVCPGPIRGRPAAERYAHLDSAGSLPPEAMQGGGGAKIRGLDPERLAGEILTAAARRRLLLVRPRKALLLVWVSAIWPSLGDRLLKRMTS